MTGEVILKSLTELYSKLPTKIMLTGTTALAGALYAPVAMAQVSAPDTVVEAADADEIVVTGIRQALKEARDLKRAADTACLLYTSPSPRDGLLSRMPSSA